MPLNSGGLVEKRSATLRSGPDSGHVSSMLDAAGAFGGRLFDHWIWLMGILLMIEPLIDYHLEGFRDWADKYVSRRVRTRTAITISVLSAFLATFLAFDDEYKARHTAETQLTHLRGQMDARSRSEGKPTSQPAVPTGQIPGSRETSNRAKPSAVARPSSTFAPITPQPRIAAAPTPNFVAPPPTSPTVPRTLTDDQERFLVSSLSPFSDKISGSRIDWTPGDQETFKFAYQFQKVFTLSGLRPNLLTRTPDNPRELGNLLIINANTPEGLINQIKSILNHAGISAEVIKKSQDHGAPSIILFIAPRAGIPEDGIGWILPG